MSPCTRTVPIRSPEEAVRLATRASDLTHRTDAAALDALAAAQARLGRFDEAVALHILRPLAWDRISS